ncbi:MAG: hypothetical protein PHH70_03310 [Candidatus Gracilibacteria bacterium]|nr:hypothetical protein [Candidatus Gracilibacteria bacterium]
MKKFLAISICILSVVGIGASGVSAQALSRNDQLFREDIQYRLPTKTQAQIYGIINGYKLKIAKMDKTSADALTDSIIAKIDRILYIMSAAESNNRQLRKQPSNKYKAYMLIKFELLLLK